MDDLMTVEEVARHFRLASSTIRSLAAAGDIPAQKIGGSWRFDRNKVKAHAAPREQKEEK